MPNIYEGYADRDYAVQMEVLLSHLHPGMTVADIGANNGSQILTAAQHTADCHFYAVEPDRAVLPQLQALALPSGSLRIFPEGADEFLARPDLPNFDLVFSGSTLHHIHITNRELGPGVATRRFLAGCRDHLGSGQKLVVSDRYYHPSATQAEVEASMAEQMEVVGHADERWAFISSSLLRSVAERLGFRLLESREHTARGPALRYFYIHVYALP